MRTAERVFGTASQSMGLLETAATALAMQPGHVCLVSLVDDRGGEQVLRPACAVRRAPTVASLPAVQQLAPDAFSRAVQRSGGALRMRLGNPRLWRLWLPPAYWAYADQVHIKAVLAAALTKHGRVVGTLLLWREGETAAAYSAADQAYVTAMATRLALALAPA